MLKRVVRLWPFIKALYYILFFSFSIQIAVKTLPFYHKYFSIDYPLPKMDLVAIADYTGAMENWGLIVYG